MSQPFGLVGVVVQAQPAHKGFIAAHDHHDEQVGDHHHVDQRQHHKHDHGFVQRGDLHLGLVADAGHQGL